MKLDDLYGSLRQEIALVPLVDAHNHLPTEAEWLTQPETFGYSRDFTAFLVCASAEIVRDNLALALAGKIARGEMTRAHALELARWYLHDNAWHYFQLDQRWAREAERKRE
jgi:hypothetical protein